MNLILKKRNVVIGPMGEMLATHRATNAPLTKIGLLRQKIEFLAKMLRLGLILGRHTIWRHVLNVGGQSAQNETRRFLLVHKGEVKRWGSLLEITNFWSF